MTTETVRLDALVGPLPCPFCGDNDISVVDGSTFRWRYAICQTCGAQSGEVRVQTMGDGTKEEWEKVAEKAAIAEWNKRHNADAACAPKFANVYCSQCGREFGPGDHGYSHCDDHAGHNK